MNTNVNSIKIVQYDPLWPKYFEQEAKSIKKILGRCLQKIHHIGSTSIFGMPAKPIVDIMLEVVNLDEIQFIEKSLMTLGFAKLNRSVMPHRSYFSFKVTDYIRYNCHLYEMGDPQVSRHVRFCDYLRQHPDEAITYAELKTKLASGDLQDIAQYVKGKDSFVRHIDAKAKIFAQINSNVRSEVVQNVGQPIAEWSKQKIIHSMEANFNLSLTYFTQYAPKIHFVRCPGYVLVDSGLANEHCNYILDTHFNEDDVTIKIQQLVDYFTNRNLPFNWWVAPYDKPTELSELLTKILKPPKDRIGVYLDLEQWQSSYPIQRMESINNQADFRRLLTTLSKNNLALTNYLQLICDIYEPDDPIKFFVAYENGVPITCMMLVFYAQIVGMYPIFTANDILDSNRHALENFLLGEAKKAGYHVAVLHAHDQELISYVNRGFIKACVFKKFTNTR